MVRNNKGQFVQGNGGGPGRPKKAKEERYYAILITTCTDKDWKAIIERAISDAKKGDTSARKWLADYLIGPPVERKEITGANNQPVLIEVVYDDKESEE
jgi:hypothetical protein